MANDAIASSPRNITNPENESPSALSVISCWFISLHSSESTLCETPSASSPSSSLLHISSHQSTNPLNYSPLRASLFR